MVGRSASVLVRFLVADDRQQARIAGGFVAAGAWVSHVVLAQAGADQASRG